MNGGKQEQINHIIATIKLYRENEPFSNRQIKQYIKKLNDISQRFADRENYDNFYHQMVELLEDGEFKRWVDDIHEDQMDKVETDVESLDTPDTDEEEFVPTRRNMISRRITNRRRTHRR